MNQAPAFCMLAVVASVFCHAFPTGLSAAQERSPSTKANGTDLQIGSRLKWVVPSYRGLILGKSRRADAERMLGRPRWSGIPEEAVFEPDRDNELWYEYDGVDGSPGRTTVVMDRRQVVVTVILYPKRPLALSRAIELYGNRYIEKKWGPCLTDRDLSQIKGKDKPPSDTFLVYPEKGMYLHLGERGNIGEIGYLMLCP